MPDELQYDPDAVRKLVVRLYRRAHFVLVLWPIIGALIGWLAGREVVGDLAVVIGAALGYLLGSRYSIHYKVHAQTLLWQKRLEEHARTK